MPISKFPTLAKGLAFLMCLLLSNFSFTQSLDSSIVKNDSIKKADSIKMVNAKIIRDNKINATKVGTKKENQNEVWIFITCCAILLITGLNRQLGIKLHDQSVKGFLNFNLIGQSVEKNFYEFNIHQLFGFIIQNLSLALWAFYFTNGTSMQFIDQDLPFYIILFLIITTLFLVICFMQYFVLNILQLNDLAILIIKSNLSLGYIHALLLLPLFMLAYYIKSPETVNLIIQSSVIITIIYLAFRVIRGFMLFVQFFGFSIFYIILYFCTLEIIPLLVLIKFITTIPTHL